MSKAIEAKTIKFRLSDGALSAYHWQNDEAPRMVFAHANGFNAGTYRQMFEHLVHHFDIIALDLRGQGRTRLPADPEHHKSWTTYSNDIHVTLEQLDRPANILSGHSMGGASMILTGASLASPLPVITVEPVILPLAAYMMYYAPFGPRLVNKKNHMSAQARRRNNHWPERQTVIDRYKSRKPFSLWAEGVVEDYLTDGLIEDAYGVRLSCDPDWEAANFEAQRNPMMSSIAKLGSNLVVYKARHQSTVLNPKGVVKRGAQLETPGELTHLAPMEEPCTIANWIVAKWNEMR